MSELETRRRNGASTQFNRNREGEGENILGMENGVGWGLMWVWMGIVNWWVIGASQGEVNRGGEVFSGEEGPQEGR